MSALNTDLVRNATPNFATTLANSMLVSDTSMTLQSATGLPTATAITLVIDATDPVSGLPTPTLKEVMTGTLSGTTVSNLLRGQDSTTAQGHASGANVVMWVTANLWNDFQAAYLVGHTQLGAHVSNLPLTSPKITTGINDSNNVKIIGLTATGSAVNQINVADAATGNDVTLSATGSDNNISINLVPKGTGIIKNNGAGAPLTATVATSQTTNSIVYADLATVGPAVTVVIGANGMALIGMVAQMSNDTLNQSTYMSVAVSGATTQAASDTNRFQFQAAAATALTRSGLTILLTGLTPGSTTFTAKYRVSSGIGTIQDRNIWVLPL